MTDYKGIRKIRKAQWEYECWMCGALSPRSTDQFGAVEYKQRHEKLAAARHAIMLVGTAMDGIADVFTALAKPVSEMVNALQNSFVLMPPPNVPHDPALLRDRRKWGGR